MPGFDVGRTLVVEGEEWTVRAVIEGQGWDAEFDTRRQNWLAFERGDDRRYFAPLPADWETWSDDALREVFVRARPSHRRPLM